MRYHRSVMRAANQPVSWWGWHWEPPVPLSIVQILQAGNMPPRLAAMFWLAMERGPSLIVAADPPNACKTATLTALLSLTPPETVAYFTRGVGETFALPPRTDDHPTYILVNEMSDHLPVYTWDSYARRAFELLAEGYSLATTVHANTVDEVLAICGAGSGGGAAPRQSEKSSNTRSAPESRSWSAVWPPVATATATAPFAFAEETSCGVSPITTASAPDAPAPSRSTALRTMTERSSLSSPKPPPPK